MKNFSRQMCYLPFVTIAFVLLFILAGCKKAQHESGAQEANIVLRDKIQTLDPALSYDAVSRMVISQVYECLYQYSYLKRPYVLEPALAEGMPVVENNGTKYTFKLKKNVRYHDDPSFKGKPRYVTAQDIITSIKRVAFIPTKSPGYWLFDDRVKGIKKFRDETKTLEQFYKNSIEGISAPDENTLVIELLVPFPQLIYALAMPFTSPMPVEAVEAYKNLFIDKMIGTGPFVLKNYNRDSFVEMEKNPHFREEFYPSEGDSVATELGLLKDAGKKLPFLDKVKFQIMKEAQTQWLNFNTGKIDYVVLPKDNFSSAIDTSKNELTSEMKNKKVVLQVSPTITWWWLAFNMKNPVLGKHHGLRMAIAQAIDVDKFIELFTNKTGQKANSIFPPGIPGYDADHKLPYTYNVEEAKKTLAKAGFPDGKGLPTLVYDVRGNDTVYRQQAEFIQKELEKIGIKVQVQTNSFPDYLNKARQGDLQFFGDGWTLDYPDAENAVQLLTTKAFPPGPNNTHFSKPELDKLYQQLSVLPEGPEKVELVKKVETLVEAELPWLMTFYQRNYILHHYYLKNFRHSDLIVEYMKYLKIEK